jgi:hypothetical protein
MGFLLKSFEDWNNLEYFNHQQTNKCHEFCVPVALTQDEGKSVQAARSFVDTN